MWLRPIILLAWLLILGACDNRETDPEIPPRAEVTSPGEPRTSATPSAPEPRRDVFLTRLEDDLAEATDEQLPGVIERIRTLDDSVQAREQIITTYENTRLRPEVVRLPVILELARMEAIEPSLQQTILAELGTILETDYGQSWGDWSLALEEYLANQHGLIRVDRTD